ncbi:hypothetical protein V9T40_002431 [Parthenolecanium corni]|uniref:Uncharacterized protein n=1 Tax=Parthenolecanium corni TaxID=536013 RepID=A0AAN9TG87_9HEMI
MQSQHPSTSSIEMNNVVSVTRPSGTSETRHPLQPPPPQQHHHYPVIQQPISSGDFRLPGAPPQSHSQKPQQAAPAAHIVSSSTCSPPSAQSNVIMRPPPPPPPLPLKISRTFSSAPQDVKPSHQEEPTSSIPDLGESFRISLMDGEGVGL